MGVFAGNRERERFRSCDEASGQRICGSVRGVELRC